MGNTALVTGASSGIGAELARLHAAKGGNLVLVARREAALNQLKSELENTYGITATVITADLAQPDAAEKIFDDELKPYAQKIAAHFAALAEQMQKQGGKDADPQEVADKIYECATTETPVHNIVGADAEMLMGMINSMSRQEFINQMGVMLTPQEAN
ncbi:MAG: SDR family NAD(P)-dependent oxidoreductase [Symploca sp. SIO1B1]|nr:SDR family NAD(P)-dependent oxidoreductase [Symploca sp. SIO1B1]